MALVPFGDGDHTVHERACKTSFECRISEVKAILESMTGMQVG